MDHDTAASGAGWYPDPHRPGVQHHWDGQAWTGSSPGASWPGGPTPPVAKTDGFAIAALVLSIIGGLLLSVIFAFVARGRIKRSGGALTGKGLTTAALMISGLWVVGIVVGLALATSGVLEQENADDFTGEEREVATVVDRFEASSFEEICGDLFTDELVARFGGTEACHDALDVEGYQVDIDISTITIEGDTAIAPAEEGGEHVTFVLVRQGDGWLIDDLR